MVCITMLVQKHEGQGSSEPPPPTNTEPEATTSLAYRDPASPSVTFVVSFFAVFLGALPLHKGGGILLSPGRSKGLFILSAGATPILESEELRLRGQM